MFEEMFSYIYIYEEDKNTVMKNTGMPTYTWQMHFKNFSQRFWFDEEAFE